MFVCRVYVVDPFWSVGGLIQETQQLIRVNFLARLSWCIFLRIASVARLIMSRCSNISGRARRAHRQAAG